MPGCELRRAGIADADDGVAKRLDTTGECRAADPEVGNELARQGWAVDL